ncbi:MAG TPA: DUF5985 family protein [Burkholderiales bacterium]
MASVVYALCALMSLCVAWLLFRGFVRTRQRLLFWSGLCFAGLAANNVMLVLDRVVFPTAINLALWRSVPALIGLLLLVYGLISED